MGFVENPPKAQKQACISTPSSTLKSTTTERQKSIFQLTKSTHWFSVIIYEYMIANFAVYLSYGYGNYKMEALRDAFEGTDLEFHTAVLTVGPTTYEILARYI